MRALAIGAVGVAAVAALALPSVGNEHGGVFGAAEPDVVLGAAEQILVCDGFLPRGCTVVCSAAGTEFFASTEVRRAFLTGFGSHTLLQLQESGLRSDITSILVGATTHCRLDGLRDPAFGGFAFSGAP